MLMLELAGPLNRPTYHWIDDVAYNIITINSVKSSAELRRCRTDACSLHNTTSHRCMGGTRNFHQGGNEVAEGRTYGGHNLN